MECQSKTIIHSDDCRKNDRICIKEEHCNSDELSTESQKHHLQHSEAYIEEYVLSSGVDTKIGIKQEIWDSNIVSFSIKSEEPPTCLGTGTIKGENEVYIKGEPRWGDVSSTDSHNEKETELDMHEASKDMLPLQSTRLPPKAVTFLNAEKDGTSYKPVCQNNASQGNPIRQNISSLNPNPTCDSGHFESGQNKGDESAQEYKCEICDKCYAHKSSLKKHQLLHSGTKPYKCDICIKCFTRKSSLQTHILLHSGIKPYKCDTCEMCFMYKSDLQRHKLLHSGTKPYKCDICEKCFAQKSTLQGHTSLHVVTKQYKCNICEKCFTQKALLQSHKLLHSSTTPYKCAICEKCFIQTSDLQRHKLIHSGIKQFKCDICEKCFTQKSNLLRHTLQHTITKPCK